MDDKKAYLTDFGLSKIISEFVDNSYMTSTVACNAIWAAPELIRATYDIEHNERRIESTKACDIYSYGCIVQEVGLLTTFLWFIFTVPKPGDHRTASICRAT